MLGVGGRRSRSDGGVWGQKKRSEADTRRPRLTEKKGQTPRSTWSRISMGFAAPSMTFYARQPPLGAEATPGGRARSAIHSLRLWSRLLRPVRLRICECAQRERTVSIEAGGAARGVCGLIPCSAALSRTLSRSIPPSPSPAKRPLELPRRARLNPRMNEPRLVQEQVTPACPTRQEPFPPTPA